MCVLYCSVCLSVGVRVCVCRFDQSWLEQCVDTTALLYLYIDHLQVVVQIFD